MADSLKDLVAKLGSCRRCDDQDSQDGIPAAKAMRSASRSEHAQVSCTIPALSLSDTLDESTGDKMDVRQRASSLLACPIQARTAAEVAGLRNQLRDNFFASFDTLVDARLQVYSRCLGSHCLALASEDNACEAAIQAVEYKLRTLLEIGTQLSADCLQTDFKAPDSSALREDNAESIILRLPIVFRADISKLQVRNNPLDLHFEAFGEARGICNQQMDLQSVEIVLDCDALLAAMIEKAALVVSQVVDATNESWRKLSSMQALPSMESKATPPFSSQEISVTPTVRSIVTRDEHEQAPLDIHERSFPVQHVDTACCQSSVDSFLSVESEKAEGGTLSPEKCAHIIDFVFGEVEAEAEFACPPRKKQRMIPRSE